MKVKFKKDYEASHKTYKKGQIYNLHPSFVKELEEKKLVAGTDEITEEEKAIKAIKKD